MHLIFLRRNLIKSMPWRMNNSCKMGGMADKWAIAIANIAINVAVSLNLIQRMRLTPKIGFISMAIFFAHLPTTGVGELILYCPYDGVISDVAGGILRTLMGVRALGTGNIACLDCVCGVIFMFAICCFCGVDKFDVITLWLGDGIAGKMKSRRKNYEMFLFNVVIFIV